MRMQNVASANNGALSIGTIRSIESASVLPL